MISFSEIIIECGLISKECLTELIHDLPENTNLEEFLEQELVYRGLVNVKDIKRVRLAANKLCSSNVVQQAIGQAEMVKIHFEQFCQQVQNVSEKVRLKSNEYRTVVSMKNKK